MNAEKHWVKSCWRKGYLHSTQESAHRFLPNGKEGNPHFQWKDPASAHKPNEDTAEGTAWQDTEHPHLGDLPQTSTWTASSPQTSHFQRTANIADRRGHKETADKPGHRVYKTAALVSSKSQCHSGEGTEKVARRSFSKLRLKRYNDQIQCLIFYWYVVPKRESTKDVFGSTVEI